MRLKRIFDCLKTAIDEGVRFVVVYRKNIILISVVGHEAQIQDAPETLSRKRVFTGPKPPRCSEQSTRGAARFVLKEGYSNKAVGVCHITSCSLVAKLRDDVGQKIVHASVEEELRHLREENHHLRMEREIPQECRGVLRDGGSVVTLICPNSPPPRHDRQVVMGSYWVLVAWGAGGAGSATTGGTPSDAA